MKIQKAPNLTFPKDWKSESCSDELFSQFSNGGIVEVDSFDSIITLPDDKLVYVFDIINEE
jgi:hypothetical protein